MVELLCPWELQEVAYPEGAMDKAQGEAIPVETMEESGSKEEAPARARSTRMVDGQILKRTLEQPILADGPLPEQWTDKQDTTHEARTAEHRGILR